MKKLFFILILICFFSVNGFSAEISGDIFGRQNRHIHPAAALGIEYTDNLYNSNTDKESDIALVFSPSIALAVPGTKDVDIVMNTDTGAPGGLSLSRDRIDSKRKYLGYFIYNPKAEVYKENTDENMVSHTIKAAGQYNAPGGLSLDIAGRFSNSSEQRGEVGNREQDEYKDLLFDFIARYDVGAKLFVKGKASSYSIDYDLKSSEFRNRSDKSFGLSAGYKLSPKTEVALEYQRAEVNYDEAVSVNNKIYYRDSTEDIYSANFSWYMTGKSKGVLKFGSVSKSFDSGNDADDMFAELNIIYRITTRKRLQFAASRRFYETNWVKADYYISDKLSFFYEQKFTSKITGSINLYWTSDDYDSMDLKNNIYQLNPAVEYKYNDWLSFKGGYVFETRSSDYESLEYDTNRLYVSVNGQF